MVINMDDGDMIEATKNFKPWMNKWMNEKYVKTKQKLLGWYCYDNNTPKMCDA